MGTRQKSSYRWHSCWSFKKDIKSTKPFKPKWPYTNLDKSENEAIKDLFKREDIILFNHDKGGAVVIVGTRNYIKKVECQLNDKGNYHTLPQDLALGEYKSVNQANDHFKKEKLITERIADGLKTSDARTPSFYITPKIYKPGNPGRPVVSSVNCHKSNISKYIDYHLQSVVKQGPSYIKDTNELINI